MPDSLDWVAGVFEGEGTFCSVRNLTNRFGKPGIVSRFTVAVTMTDRDIIERFNKAVGVGSVKGPYQPNGNRKTVWRWSATNRKECLEVTLKLLPFLGERRTKDADRLIGLAELVADLKRK